MSTSNGHICTKFCPNIYDPLEFSSRVTTRLTFVEFSDILVSFSMSCNNFVDHMTFHLKLILTFVMICWRVNIKLRSNTKQQRVMNTCSKITGGSQLSLSSLYDRHLVGKATSILADTFHPLHQKFLCLFPSNRLRFSSIK